MSKANGILDYDEWTDDETCIVLKPVREAGVYCAPIIEDDIPGSDADIFDDPDPAIVHLDALPRGGSSTFHGVWQ